ncbi:MAG: MFS transporter [Pseudomonadales bacterium]
MSEPRSIPPLARSPGFAWYLTGSSLWMGGMSLQGFLFTWMLVGILERPPDDVGLARSLAEFPALLVLLVGGLLGDRLDGRRLLLILHAAMALPPLVLAMLMTTSGLDYGAVVAFGMTLAALQALSDPARQSMLSLLAGTDTQRAVTLTSLVTTLVGMGAFYVGGWLDQLGLPLLLTVQAVCFLIGMAAIGQLPPLPPSVNSSPAPSISQTASELRAGLRAVVATPIVRSMIGLNLASSLFNAGAYIVVLPVIVKTVYDGDAAFFSTVLLVFTAGSIGSNLVLLTFMPLMRPGRVFLLMQPVRVVILLVLMLEPSRTVLLATLFLWGVNMGVTSTLVRTTVQECAPVGYRSQVLSWLQLSFMIAAPASAALLGALAAWTSPLTALWPGIVVSVLIVAIGGLATGLPQYRAPLASS